MGDLANGRTVRSLAYMLGANYANVSFVFVAPAVVKMQDDIKQFLDERGCKWTEAEDLLEVCACVRVCVCVCALPRNWVGTCKRVWQRVGGPVHSEAGALPVVTR